MSNSYFQFKQFRIDQDRCAMKVSTDACIQGAWTPVPSTIKRVFDIGTGTGLLSLMLTQRNEHVLIDAVELEPEATTQAKENIAASKWNDRISIIEGDVRDLKFDTKFDLIISNPPFFNNSLLSDREERNKARHTLSLSYEDLFKVIHDNLSDEGYASILLPTTEHNNWKALVEKYGWNIYHQLNIKPKVNSPANRVVSLCQRTMIGAPLNEDLIIRDKANNYTPEFIHLLRPFYLML